LPGQDSNREEKAMKLSGNTVLVTGGATGIGLALAEALLQEGSRVLVCGRREEKLRSARQKLPDLAVRVCDISDPEERRSLAAWAEDRGANILVNNAGMQRMVDFAKGAAELETGDNEVRINFEAPVYLTALMLPGLISREEAAIVNVSSGLAFVPIAAMPVYCATKAAIHSLTVSLRHQLRATRVKVFEAIPPIVDTELDRGARDRRGQIERGISPALAAARILEAVGKDQLEIAIEGAGNLVQGSRQNFDQIFRGMNRS
jgi:uncharacterized oxidoreductase